MAEKSLRHLRTCAVVRADEQHAPGIAQAQHASPQQAVDEATRNIPALTVAVAGVVGIRTASGSTGFVALTIALYMPSATEWVGVSVTSTSPASVSPRSNSENDSAPAM